MKKGTDHSYEQGRYGLIVTDGVFGKANTDSEGLEGNLTDYLTPTINQPINEEDDD